MLKLLVVETCWGRPWILASPAHESTFFSYSPNKVPNWGEMSWKTNVLLHLLSIIHTKTHSRSWFRESEREREDEQTIQMHFLMCDSLRRGAAASEQEPTSYFDFILPVFPSSSTLVSLQLVQCHFFVPCEMKSCNSWEWKKRKLPKGNSFCLNKCFNHHDLEYHKSGFGTISHLHHVICNVVH